MKQIYTIILVSSLALFVSGCSYWNDYFGTTDGQGVAVEHFGEGTNLGARVYAEADEFSATYGRDVALHTQGRVEVFPLGASGAGQGNVVAMPETDAFKSAARPVAEADNGVMVRPSVEVYGVAQVPAMPSYQAQPVGGAYREPLVIYFDYNSSRLGSVDLAHVADFAASYRGTGMTRIAVEGHASPENGYGQDVGNMKVSLDRANAVAKALVDSGVPADQVTVQAFGAPSFMRGTKDANSTSQRVEVYVR